jgi:hypothetical protein
MEPVGLWTPDAEAGGACDPPDGLMFGTVKLSCNLLKLLSVISIITASETGKIGMSKGKCLVDNDDYETYEKLKCRKLTWVHLKVPNYRMDRIAQLHPGRPPALIGCNLRVPYHLHSYVQPGVRCPDTVQSHRGRTVHIGGEVYA